MPVIKQLLTPDFAAYHADTVELARDMPSESVDFSVFSPPFASLYTFSASERDMGNCRDTDDFMEHYAYLIKEQRRVMRPGRLVAIHCMLMPTSKAHHGYIGLRDFRGDIIRAYQKEGFIFHSEVTIWKDPVTAMQRTKALGLLWKTIKKDSSMSRQGIPDYVVTMRAPGENLSPIHHTAEEFPVDQWQKWASPVWMDINPSDTLQYQSARAHEDERHIAPLQLQVIRRCIGLWSNPGDLVWSPFMGIGSEGHVALQMGRRFVGVELKDSYFGQAIKNLQAAKGVQGDLFAEAMPPPTPVVADDDSWDADEPTAEEEVGQTKQSTIEAPASAIESNDAARTDEHRREVEAADRAELDGTARAKRNAEDAALNAAEDAALKAKKKATKSKPKTKAAKEKR